MTKSWDRRAWRIAWPTVLSNVSVPLLGAVDLAVVGHLPDPKYLGAVAVGALIFTVIYHGFIFLRMGTTGLTAQALGLAKPDEVRAWLVRGGVLAGSIGCGLVACQMPIIWVGNALISPSPEIATLAGDYIAIRIWGAPAALFNFALLGWFFGIQKAHAALITQVFMNVLNIGLDLWFVTGLELGVEGVAYATVIAQVSTVVVGLVLVQFHLKPIGGQFVTSRILDGKSVRRMLQINGDIFIRSVLVQGCFAVITVLGARFGEMTLAANAILFNFVILIAYILDGYSHAAETLAGEAVGARRTLCHSTMQSWRRYEEP